MAINHKEALDKAIEEVNLSTPIDPAVAVYDVLVRYGINISLEELDDIGNDGCVRSE